MELHLSRGHWLVVALLLFTAGTMIVTYSTALALDIVYKHPSPPFISATGDIPPAMNLFTMGFSLTACIYCFTAVLVFLAIKLRIETIKERNDVILHPKARMLSIMNVVQFVIGMVAAFSMFGVAAWQYPVSHFVHLLFAGLVFFFSAIDMSILSYMSWKIRGISTYSTKITLMARSLSAIGIWVFLFSMGIASTGGRPLMGVQAVFEILSALMIPVFFCTFWRDLKMLRLTVADASQELDSGNAAISTALL